MLYVLLNWKTLFVEDIVYVSCYLSTQTLVEGLNSMLKLRILCTMTFGHAEDVCLILKPCSIHRYAYDSCLGCKCIRNDNTIKIIYSFLLKMLSLIGSFHSDVLCDFGNFVGVSKYFEVMPKFCEKFGLRSQKLI